MSLKFNRTHRFYATVEDFTGVIDVDIKNGTFSKQLQIDEKDSSKNTNVPKTSQLVNKDNPAVAERLGYVGNKIYGVALETSEIQKLNEKFNKTREKLGFKPIYFSTEIPEAE